MKGRAAVGYEKVEERKTKTKNKKRRKKTGKSYEPLTAVSEGGLPELPEDLVREVLLRVRHKTLGECKCVSKSWCSIIRSPGFMEAHRSRRPGGLLVYFVERDLDSGNIQVRFFYSTLGVEEAAERRFRCRLNVPASCFCTGVTQVVNGLVCIYEGHRGYVYVMNVCTGEKMRLPDNYIATLTGESRLYFGYDPAGKVYKLLKLAMIRTVVNNAEARFSHLECEILTLGLDSSWRKLDVSGFPNVNFVDPITIIPSVEKSCLVNGVLYWVGQRRPQGLMSFDLNKEKFRYINFPEKHDDLSSSYGWNLAQVMGRLALWTPSYVDSFYLHILENDDSDGNSTWSSRHSIPLPPEFQDSEDSTIAARNLPNGQMLLLNPYATKTKESESLTPVYSYDHQKHKLERIVVGNSPFRRFSGAEYPVNACWLVENFSPLDVVLSGV